MFGNPHYNDVDILRDKASSLIQLSLKLETYIQNTSYSFISSNFTSYFPMILADDMIKARCYLLCCTF